MSSRPSSASLHRRPWMHCHQTNTAAERTWVVVSGRQHILHLVVSLTQVEGVENIAFHLHCTEIAMMNIGLSLSKRIKSNFKLLPVFAASEMNFIATSSIAAEVTLSLFPY
jgi:hypothetical protein